jgi:glycine/D-amino acid oxidase-like deaminating enzyme
MLTDPVALIDQTIHNLEDLAELFADEFDERIHATVSEDGRICREAYARIRALVPKLKAARITQMSPAHFGQRPFCLDCD